jgi:acetyl/propionyl-CoA carboxylase alpha subunit
MADHDGTWARIVHMARAVYPDEPDLTALHTREAYDVEEMAVYARQAEHLHAGAGVSVARAEMAEAVAEGYGFIQTL